MFLMNLSMVQILSPLLIKVIYIYKIYQEPYSLATYCVTILKKKKIKKKKKNYVVVVQL